MIAAGVSNLTGVQRSITLLADRLDSLPRRFGASHVALRGKTVPQLAEELGAAGREAAFNCCVLSSRVCKALEAAAEEARVRAAQLVASAMLLERDAEDADVGVVARALLSLSSEAAPAFVVIMPDNAALRAVVQAAVRVRGGIDPLRCTSN